MISHTAQSGEMEPSMNRHIACLLNSSDVSRKLPRFTLFRNTSALRATALARRIALPLPDSTRVICAFVWSCMLACCLISAPTIAQNNPCCGPHAGMGCFNQECNDTVCLLDPFCCSIAWDERCALEAGVLCQVCRSTTECQVPIPDLDEMNSCGIAIPQNCENSMDARALIPGLKFGGQAWSTDIDRDVDWFEIWLDTPQLLSIEMWTTGSIGVAILDDQCPPTTLAEGVDGCSSITRACVPAGRTRVVVRSILFDNISCQDERSHYTIQASVTPCTPVRLINDRCDMALPVNVGQTFADTTNATSENTWLPTSCDDGAGLAFTHDAWFTFTAHAWGIFQVNTCNVLTFDSRIAVYSDCGGDLLACSDDACDGDGAMAEFEMACGETAFIRVGGWGVGGPITLSIEPVSTSSCNCPADFDSSGEVNSADVGLCLAHFGEMGGPLDLNGDGEVSSGDLGIILLSFGNCPP